MGAKYVLHPHIFLLQETPKSRDLDDVGLRRISWPQRPLFLSIICIVALPPHRQRARQPRQTHRTMPNRAMGRGSTRHAPPHKRRGADVRRVAGARERAAASGLPAAARPLAQAPLPLLELGHALGRAGRAPPQTNARARALLAVMIQFIRSINASAIDFFPQLSRLPRPLQFWPPY